MDGRDREALDVAWIHGAPRRRQDSNPPIHSHWYDDATVILRQNKAVHAEAPFMYLLLGRHRAVLLDTGATEVEADFPLRRAVDSLIEHRLRDHPCDGYGLVVLHSHAHGDHVAADGQFAGRPDTTVVGHSVSDVTEFLGFSGWPAEVVTLDLGDRVLDITGIPGHHVASIAIFDPWTGFLLTGDTVYPGRLYIEDPPAFADSLDRLTTFAAARDVSAVMGCHIEMTRTPGRDYPIGCAYQPDEQPLPMAVERLAVIRDAARDLRDRPGVHRFEDFILHVGPCTAGVVRSVLRAKVGNALGDVIGTSWR